MSKVVGIIGLGSIAHKHIVALREIDSSMKFVALRHSASAENEPGIENVFSYDELLLRKPNFVILSNPTNKHREVIEQLADKEVPLFIEKPLFDALSPIPKVNAMTYVACNLRFLACLRYLKSALEGKRINEVNAYCGSYLPDWRPDTDWRACYSANKEMGGGVHIDLIHEIDYIYWFFGKPNCVHKTFRSRSSLDITAYDYANYVLEYPEFTVSVLLNYYRRDYKRTLEVLTDDETWKVDLAQNSVWRNNQLVFQSKQLPSETYLEQMKSYLNNSASNDIEEAYEVLKICLQ